MSERKAPDYHAIVSHPFEVYNGIFLTLPLDGIRATGLRVPVLQEACETGLAADQRPQEILDAFFKAQGVHTVQEKFEMLFRIVQYIERQVVLVDALEDARYAQLHDFQGEGSLTQLMQRVRKAEKGPCLRQAIRDLGVRVVLTSQATPFYPGTALGIVTDLAEAMEQNDLVLIRKLLHQLGLTPFFPATRPTVVETATRQMWYLENVFYEAGPQLMARVAQAIEDPSGNGVHAGLVAVGSWPGGDDKSAAACSPEELRAIGLRYKVHLLRCYRRDIRQLRRRITFKDVAPALEAMQEELDNFLREPQGNAGDARDWDLRLERIAETVEQHCDGLFVEEIRLFQFRLRMMGFYLASMDIRINAQVGADERAHADAAKRMFEAGADVQRMNGERGCHRCLVVGFRAAEDVLRVFDWACAFLGTDSPPWDFVPVLDSMEALARAHETCDELLATSRYLHHLEARGRQQTLMISFSDCVLDGGYFFANSAILQAKLALHNHASRLGIDLVFLDGRGGPASRGGRYTHRYYAAVGGMFPQREVQSTIPGQTISSNFGVVRSAGYNLELMLTAGLEHLLFPEPQSETSEAHNACIAQLSNLSQQAYRSLTTMPGWQDYLTSALGAVPGDSASVVYAWTQVKQNVPGYYGLGTALEAVERERGIAALTDLYHNHAFFRALVDNSMQSMCKCDFRLTREWSLHPIWGAVWCQIESEFNRTREAVLRLSGMSMLMENQPATRESIALRNHLTRPLHIIQHVAREALSQHDATTGDAQEAQPNHRETWLRLRDRAGFGIANASRNAV